MTIKLMSILFATILKETVLFERIQLDKFQFVELNGRLMWCDLGANLVQHYMRRYSQYSRYRTKSHDKATISHDI